MGKEEREKSRKLKGQSEVELDNQLRNEKLKAYDGVIKFLRANSLFEEKVIIGNQRFSIFNGNEYAEIVERHYDSILKIIEKHYNAAKRLKGEKDEPTKRIDLTNFLLSQLVIIRVEENEKASKLRNAQDKFIPSKEQSITTDKQITDGLFIFNPHINIQSKTNYVYMVLILLGIALVILFPVWPMALKRGLFYLSVLLLFVLVGLIVVRTFVYFLVRVFGLDFYIFPNLFADVSFFESFKPLVGWEKCNDSKLMILARFVGLFVMGYLVYILSVERYTVKDFGQQTFDDILDWGYQKLEGQKAPPPRSIEQIIDEFDKEIEAQDNEE